MTNSDVRAAVSNTVVTWYEKFVQIDFSKSNEQNNQENSDTTPDTLPGVNDLQITYIPPEFKLTISVEESNKREYFYISENGEYLMVGIYSSDTTEFATNNELTEYEQISINGNEAYLLYYETEMTGSIIYGNTKYSIIITAVCSKENLLKVAENIK